MKVGQIASFLGPYHDVPPGQPTQSVGGSETTAKRLAVSMTAPKPTRWCWAATTAAVANFFTLTQNKGQIWTPCAVATQFLGQQCCPEPSDPNDGRNQDYHLETALQYTDDGHLAQPPLNYAIDFNTIVGEINLNRPVCCHINWDPNDPNNGHYNAIIGYDSTTRDLIVCDCLHDVQTIPYDEFLNAYQGTGKWDFTYLTK